MEQIIASQDKYTEEIVYQWKKTWSEKNLNQLIESCKEEGVALPYFLKHLPKNGKILECGCGLGQWVIYLSRLGYSMTGVEIVPECIEICKKFFPETDIRVGDVRSLPFSDSFFSGYISIGVVEHMIEGPETTLKEMRRIMKPGGVAILTVPSYNYFLRAWYPLRSVLVDIVRYNPWVRKILGKAPYQGDLKESRARLKALKRKVRKDFCPIIALDAVKGPLFVEYKCKREDIEQMLESVGFEIVESVPIFHPYIFHDVFGGLFFKKGNLESPELNILGKALNAAFRMISPHFFSYVNLFVAQLK